MMKPGLTQPAPGWLGPGRRVYAVGDVHGCDDRLASLHKQIAADLARSLVLYPVVVHLGDYIDRGTQSAAVVRRLMQPPPVGLTTVHLRGNHEQMMLDAFGGKRGDIAHWLGNGGDATLRSWGLSATAHPADWLQAVSAAERGFLQGLPLLHRIDGYLFVHAGLRPGVPLQRQSGEDMLWIRQDFLNHTGTVLPEAPDVAVVHGHTPRPDPEITAGRIGIDTGAVVGGPLTCAVLEERGVRFLMA